MKPVECAFESEVLAAVLQARWPERVDPELRAHASVCGICSDVAAIAGAIEDARQEVRECAVIPEAGRVWWRAQLRARREAAEAAACPITAAQVIALACTIGVLGVWFAATSSWLQSALERIRWSVAAFKIQALLPSVTPLIVDHGALLLTTGTVLLLIPAAVYLVTSRD